MLGWLPCALTITAMAAERGDTGVDTAQERPARDPDFLFGRPAASLGLRGQWHMARADSEVFTFTTELLTLEKSDFSASGLYVDLGFPIAPRVDALAGLEFTRGSSSSEYRDFVDTNEMPVEQTTTLTQVNLTASIELALLARGREIGRYAWVPARMVPYVGMGGGLLWHQFKQEGDFVDFLDLSIFTGHLTSDGWTSSAHVFGGIDIKLMPWIYLTAEARYLWAHAKMSRDFVGFDAIDLSGPRVSGGLQFLF